MPDSDPWITALGEASEQLGVPAPDIPRTVAGITRALRPHDRAVFQAELASCGDGTAFDVLLDAWWAQAAVDAYTDQHNREQALALADLAVSLRVAAARTAAPASDVDTLLSETATAR